MRSKIVFILSFFIIVVALSACSLPSKEITLLDAKIATAIDDKFQPLKVTNSFPEETANVFCWLKWKNAQTNTRLTAKWHYVTEDIHILDYAFAIPRKEGSGGISLSMPEGKTLPPGQYRVDVVLNNRTLRTLTFTITSKT